MRQNGFDVRKQEVYVNKSRIKRIIPNNIKLFNLENWCMKRIFNWKTPNDTPFMLKYYFDYLSHF